MYYKSHKKKQFRFSGTPKMSLSIAAAAARIANNLKPPNPYQPYIENGEHGTISTAHTKQINHRKILTPPTDIEIMSKEETYQDQFIGNRDHDTYEITWYIVNSTYHDHRQIDSSFILPFNPLTLYKYPNLTTDFSKTTMVNHVSRLFDLTTESAIGQFGMLIYLCTNTKLEIIGNDHLRRFDFSSLSDSWSCYIYKLYISELHKVLGLCVVSEEYSASTKHLVNAHDFYYNKQNRKDPSIVSSFNTQLAYPPQLNKMILKKTFWGHKNGHRTDYRIGDDTFTSRLYPPHAALTQKDLDRPTTFKEWWDNLKTNVTYIPKQNDPFYKAQQKLDFVFKLPDLLSSYFYNANYSPTSTALWLLARATYDIVDNVHADTFNLHDNHYHLEMPLIVPYSIGNPLVEVVNSKTIQGIEIPEIHLPRHLILLYRSYAPDNLESGVNAVDDFHLLAKVYERMEPTATKKNEWYSEKVLFVLAEPASNVIVPKFSGHLNPGTP